MEEMRDYDIKGEARQLMKDSKYFLNIVRAAIFHLKAIEAEEDKEVILIHIECLEEIDKEFPQIYPVKEMIRRGLGDYKRIQEKCIRLGIV